MPLHAQAAPLARDVGRPYHDIRIAWNRLAYAGWTDAYIEEFIRGTIAAGKDLDEMVCAALATTRIGGNHA